MWKVYVGNLDGRVRERELADEFRPYGVVRSVWVARNPPGYAFIEFEDRREADDAISALDGKHGWRVEMSRKSAGGSRHGSQGSESRCHEHGSSSHRTRDFRSRDSRNSHRRSLSPRSRTGSHRHSPSNRRERSRSPRSPPHDERYRDSSPREVNDVSRSQKSDQSKSPQDEDNNSDYGLCEKAHDHNGSQNSDQSKSSVPILSPQLELNGSDEDGYSPEKEDHDGSRSP